MISRTGHPEGFSSIFKYRNLEQALKEDFRNLKKVFKKGSSGRVILETSCIFLYLINLPV